jgi:hypothetical protein
MICQTASTSHKFRCRLQAHDLKNSPQQPALGFGTNEIKVVYRLEGLAEGMKVVIFGGSGMVGQGVLRECLLSPEVTGVLSIVRGPTGQSHAKLQERVHANFFDFSTIANELTGFDACFFCLGVSVVGKSEQEYHRITYAITLAVAEALVKRNPTMVFVYVSGMSTDSTEHGRVMWARIKGVTENALRRLPFKAVYLFRPALIVPMHGIVSKTFVYRLPYILLRPIFPLLLHFPKYVTTTEQVGRAMIKAAQSGAPSAIFENIDINKR